MKRPINHMKPYRYAELRLILTVAPTQTNIAMLADVLGRTKSAIQVIYALVYSSPSLLRHNMKVKNSHVLRVVEAKRKMGIAI